MCSIAGFGKRPAERKQRVQNDSIKRQLQVAEAANVLVAVLCDHLCARCLKAGLGRSMTIRQSYPCGIEEELQKIYDSEINVSISWLWDGGIDVRLGDHLNGYSAEVNVPTSADIVPLLQAAIAELSRGEQTENKLCLSSLRMDEQPLTEEQLFELRQNIARMSESGVKNVYQEAHKQCEMKDGPPAEACGYSAACTGLAAVVGVEGG